MTDKEIIEQFRDSINGDELWPWILLILIFGLSSDSPEEETAQRLD